MGIAKEQVIDIEQKLAHNVLSACTLFDGDLPADVKEPKLLQIVLQPL